MSGRSNVDQALCGKLGALRLAVAQQPEDCIAKLLLIMMGARANKSFECYMAKARLAAEVGCDRRTVIRKIDFLLTRGYIEDISSAYPWRRTKTYRLCANQA